MSSATSAPSVATLRARLSPTSGLRRVAEISASLVGTQAVTNVLGLAYWTVAARQTDVAAVGLASAAVALMMLLGGFGMLGLGTLLMAEVPKAQREHRHVLVGTSLLTSALASGALGFVAVAVIGGFDVAGLGSVSHPLNAVDFVIGTAITGLTMVLDQVVLVMGRSRVQLERNTLASIAKIAALVALTSTGHRSGMDIFLAWTVGNLVSLLLVAYRMRRARVGRTVGKLIDFGVLRRMARSAASHHALNLMLQAPIQLLSVVVAVLLSAQANGFFSTARSVAGFVFVLPFTVTIALFAAAAGKERDLVERMKFTVPFGLAASVAAVVVLYPFGSTVLGIFGESYSVDALTTLRILVLAGVPFVIKDHFVALRRVQGRTGNAAVFALGGAVFELSAAVLGAHLYGTTGLCSFWVAALALEALALAAPLWRAAFPRTAIETSASPAALVPAFRPMPGPGSLAGAYPARRDRPRPQPHPAPVLVPSEAELIASTTQPAGAAE